jgi:hypothetical protein
VIGGLKSDPMSPIATIESDPNFGFTHGSNEAV